MNKSALYSDASIRLIMLDYLCCQEERDERVIALEAKYGANSRRADILEISDVLHAYEIKSDLDKVSRLKEQLHDYRRTFEYVSVVTTTKMLPEIRKQLGPNEGILLITDNSVKIIRKARPNKKILKKNVLSIFSKTTLAKLMGVSVNKMPLRRLFELAEKTIALEALKVAAREELLRRFEGRYRRFLAETYPPYRETDLLVLKHGNSITVGNFLG
jgi:hypothetical protein